MADWKPVILRRVNGRIVKVGEGVNPGLAFQVTKPHRASVIDAHKYRNGSPNRGWSVSRDKSQPMVENPDWKPSGGWSAR